MEVYKFNKSFYDRLGESMQILSWEEELLPASRVCNEWSYFIELTIEPTGWQAIWKLPRIICEENKIRFPTIVFGNVEQVLFKELKAIFLVQSVQDDDVHLPERHEVNLIDLWVTKNQENEHLNFEKTADCCDRLRFFYTNVWMPWDNDIDDDVNWPEKYLKSRIRFCHDLTNHSMKRALAAHIRTLLTEARYIEQRREYIELNLSDDDEMVDVDESKTQITNLMRLHLRMTMIRHEIEMLENPEMRRIYEELKFDDEKYLKDANNSAIKVGGEKQKKLFMEKPKQKTYIVALPGSLEQQMNLLSQLSEQIPANCHVEIYTSLQNVLQVCEASDNIYLSPGCHAIKFLEYLNDEGSINGLANKKKQISNANILYETDNYPDVVISSSDDDSILLVFDGDFTLRNVTLDCHNTHTGVSVKQGNVLLQNCHLINNCSSRIQQGVVCHAKGLLTLEFCVIQNFETGILLHEGATLVLKNVIIKNCNTAIEIEEFDTKINFENVQIDDAKKCGIYIDQLTLKNETAKSLTLNSLSQLKTYCANPLPWTGDCQFRNCHKNIYIMNREKSMISGDAMKILMKTNEEKFDVDAKDEDAENEEQMKIK